MLPNFNLLPDYSRLELNGRLWLFVCGAISIKRIDRILGETWWPQEAFDFRDDLAGPAEVLVTHSGSGWIGPKTHGAFVDSCCRAEAEFAVGMLCKELNAERKFHELLFRGVKPKHCYLGHFHERVEKVRAGCHTRILDCHQSSLSSSSSSNKSSFRPRLRRMITASLTASATPSSGTVTSTPEILKLSL